MDTAARTRTTTDEFEAEMASAAAAIVAAMERRFGLGVSGVLVRVFDDGGNPWQFGYGHNSRPSDEDRPLPRAAE